MNAPELELFCRLEVDLAPIRELGSGRAGQRRIIPIIGGRASGPYVTGRILNLGADWQTVFADGVAELDTRYAIDANALIPDRNPLPTSMHAPSACSVRMDIVSASNSTPLMPYLNQKTSGSQKVS